MQRRITPTVVASDEEMYGHITLSSDGSMPVHQIHLDQAAINDFMVFYNDVLKSIPIDPHCQPVECRT